MWFEIYGRMLDICLAWDPGSDWPLEVYQVLSNRYIEPFVGNGPIGFPQRHATNHVSQYGFTHKISKIVKQVKNKTLCWIARGLP